MYLQLKIYKPLSLNENKWNILYLNTAFDFLLYP